MRLQTGDIWGGLAAMMVALPAAIGFGVIVYEPLGQMYNAQGAMAGIIGATLLGFFAAMFGGCQRLISAPCAPAAAVLAAFAIQFTQMGMPPDQILLALLLIGLLASGFQMLFGLLKLGSLIKYVPYPVVSGYLSGVGLIIIAAQTPKWLGITGNQGFWFALAAVDEWRWASLIVGLVTAAFMIIGPRITQKIPSVIMAIAGGVTTYWLLSLWDTSLQHLLNNTLIVGPLGGLSTAGAASDQVGGLTNFFSSISLPYRAMADAALPPIKHLLYPALTLAILLSIDTLKTCIVLDTLTHSRHDSNRELLGQGIGNMASALCAGMPGAGTMGASLLNMSSGARTRASGMIEGFMVLLAYVLLAPLLAWIPLSALAAILIVVGFRMVDRHSFRFLKSRDTILDFVVILTVAMVALSVSLIAATGVGLLLAVLLFLRKQIGTHLIRRITFGNQVFSRCERLESERQLLEKNGHQTVILELQGSLFFGTANQLYQAVEPYLHGYRYVILDLRRVQSVDMTAGHILEQIRDTLAENNNELLLSDLPGEMPTGENLKRYFDHLGILGPHQLIHVFDELNDAQEWIEEQWLLQSGLRPRPEQRFTLRDFDVFKNHKADTLADLQACMQAKQLKAGEQLFQVGSRSHEIFFIMQGEVRIDIPLADGHLHHIATHHQGDFIGELGFLDGRPRGDTATAITDVELLVLSRSGLDQLADNHKRLGVTLMTEIARVLASRLRQSNDELRVLESA
ncbi:MAG: cyclic nucleotide-binding domain-containing protein [Oxalobacteraceae bacterium]|nr:cyclic nucleotide-binding domain-containing protein [Oxalobacteraceae bacterium]